MIYLCDLQDKNQKSVFSASNIDVKVHVNVTKHYLNHLESGKIRFLPSLTKALRTDGQRDQPINGWTRPLIEMRGHI